ncbi:hypothetical protein SUGI_0690290 [Cryptomeria japonica]|nr:hypothetical protein SUGI_0690290 [Cryptomeria japonica]
MEEEKHDPCSIKPKKTRKGKECDIPDEQRCQRSDRKKNWRCKNARVNHIYCQHHINLTTKNYLTRKERNKQDPLNSCQKNPKEDKGSIAVEDGMACPRQKDSSQAVGISKREMNNMCRIRNPEIAQEISVPSDISDLDELLPTLLMEAWNRELNPAERHALGCLLPEGHSDDSSVMSIFSGGTSRFGIDCAGTWCKSVCEGKETPDAVLEKEREMTICQSQYLKDLKEYHEGFIAKAEWFKQLWSDTCKRNDRMFSELLEKYKPKFA